MSIAREGAEKAARQILNEDEWHDQSIAGVADELEPFFLAAVEQAARESKEPSEIAGIKVRWSKTPMTKTRKFFLALLIWLDARIQERKSRRINQ